MFFLSSPPQPPPQPHFLSSPSTIQYTPSTPSPLRTSYNANGIKRNRMSDHASSNNSDLFHSLSSPFSKPSGNTLPLSGNENEPPPRTEPNWAPYRSTITASLSFAASSPISAASSANERSGYAQRSRASTPSALLNTHATARKAQNKQRFLDRIRTRRDEGLGRDEKALRADYLSERRRWEEEMRMMARAEAATGELDQVLVEDDDEMDVAKDGGGDGESVEEQGMSPTEEREIEALLEFLDTDENPPRGIGNGDFGDASGDIGGSDGDSQGWDEVFMEVLSTQQNPHFAPESTVANKQHGESHDRQEDGSMDVDMS